MGWIKVIDRLPNKKDGSRVGTFSSVYPKDSEMRHRNMDFGFVKICKEITNCDIEGRQKIKEAQK